MCRSSIRVSSRQRVAVLAIALLIATFLAPALPASASTAADAAIAPTSSILAQAWVWLTSVLSTPTATTSSATQPSTPLPGEWTSDKDPDGHQ
jgi:hypothetical protein